MATDTPAQDRSSLTSRIHFVRGQKIMLDADLAELYGISTRVFNQAIKRNSERFPLDFMFRLDDKEYKSLRSQFVISNVGRGGRRHSPMAFTEHGAIMAATILNSQRAIEMSVFIVRAFVQLRDMVSNHSELTDKLNKLESKVSGHDQEIANLFETIRQLMMSPTQTRRFVGFRTNRQERDK